VLIDDITFITLINNNSNKKNSSNHIVKLETEKFNAAPCTINLGVLIDAVNY